MATSDAPAALYLSYYDDADAAQADFDDLSSLVDDGVIKMDAMVLVRRDPDGTIDVKDSDHMGRKGAGIGAVAGLLVGALFPPSLLGGAAAGALVGGGVGSLVSRHDRKEIKADLADGMPPESSAIAAVFDEVWVDRVEDALTRAVKREQKKLDDESTKAVKEAERRAG